MSSKRRERVTHDEKLFTEIWEEIWYLQGEGQTDRGESPEGGILVGERLF